VTQAEWTYQVPVAGASSAGLEEYQVESSSGEHVGKVVTVLSKDGCIYLAVETGTPPIKRELRAVPWTDVAEIDHATLTVRLGPSVEIERALMLDPGKAVEGGPADATLAEPPEEDPGRFDPETRGPLDRTLPYAATFGLAAVGLLALLATVALASAADSGWIWLLLLAPSFLLFGALVSGYRLFRRPYESSRALRETQR
jgi:hypothetical protein